MFSFTQNSIKMKTCLKISYLVLIALVMGCSSLKNEKTSDTKDISTTLPSGLTYEIINKGTGEVAKEGQEVLIHETMSYLNNSKVLFSSREIGHPIKFQIGGNQVIKGVDEGVKGMRKGEIRKLIVPPALSKRSVYPSFLSPDSTLLYKIELVDIL